MKNPDRETVSRLEDLPNIGKACVVGLRLIGIDHPRRLAGKDPMALYKQLCAVSGRRHDPCMIDVLMPVVDFMNGGQSRPW